MPDPKISGWGIIETAIEELREYFRQTTKPKGAVWDKLFIPSIIKEDRGFRHVDFLYEMYNDDFDSLYKHLLTYKDAIPAYKEELEIMDLLKQKFLIPAEEIIQNAGSGGRRNFTPEEVGEVIDDLSRIRTFKDYLDGYNEFRYTHFINHIPVAYLVDAMIPPFDALIKSWGLSFKINEIKARATPPNHEPIDYDSVPVYGCLTLFGIDSEDGPLIPKVLSAEDPSKILLSEIPKKGIERVVLEEREDVKSKTINDIKGLDDPNLTDKSERYSRIKNHCNVGQLRIRLNPEKLFEYEKEISRLSADSIKKYVGMLEQEKIKEEQKKTEKYIT